METSSAYPLRPLRKRDWLRFQVNSSRIVLEGFVQAVSPDGARILIGKSSDSTENTGCGVSEKAIHSRQGIFDRRRDAREEHIRRDL
jgi:hypothetical protein